MDLLELFRMLELPDEISRRLADYGNSRTAAMPDSIRKKILLREEWDEGIKELQDFLGEDPEGIKILWELLNLVCSYSFPEYEKRGISSEIFLVTMKFCTRCINEYKRAFHVYGFDRGWWFPRQISLQEYRIAALEYEFIDGEEREIAVHIPSDADLRTESVLHSLEEFSHFRQTYYPGWENVKMTCESWMMMPELKVLLGESSNIVAFQSMFEIDEVDHEADWYMEWIFPGCTVIDDTLPENTSLQRKMKAFLLEGNKFGAAKGHLKEEFMIR